MVNQFHIATRAGRIVVVDSDGLTVTACDSLGAAERICGVLNVAQADGDLIVAALNVHAQATEHVHTIAGCIPSTLADMHTVLVPVGTLRAVVDLHVALDEVLEELRGKSNKSFSDYYDKKEAVNHGETTV